MALGRMEFKHPTLIVIISYRIETETIFCTLLLLQYLLWHLWDRELIEVNFDQIFITKIELQIVFSVFEKSWGGLALCDSGHVTTSLPHLCLYLYHRGVYYA